MSEQKREPPASGYTWARAGFTIDAKNIVHRFDINITTLWRWVEAKRFPAPMKIGNRRAWLETTIEDFMRSNSQAA